MYKVSRSLQNGVRHASVVQVKRIVRSVMLIPQFGPVVPREWTSSNVLETCNEFYVNPYVDEHTFRTIY